MLTKAVDLGDGDALVERIEAASHRHLDFGLADTAVVQRLPRALGRGRIDGVESGILIGGDGDDVDFEQRRLLDAALGVIVVEPDPTGLGPEADRQPFDVAALEQLVSFETLLDVEANLALD